MRTILITGGTGSLGQELIRQLFSSTQEEIEVILLSRKQSHRSIQDEGFNHLLVYEADLCNERLGLSDAIYSSLLTNVTEIFHLAASVRFDLPLSEARNANVIPTKNLLAFAKAAKNFTHFHHVSTYAVGRSKSESLVHEMPPDLSTDFRNTYEQSKAEAEACLLEENIPFTIYRPSIIVGHSQTGATTKFDAFYLPLRLLSKTKTAEYSKISILKDARIDAITVDSVASAIVSISEYQRASRKSGEIFHITLGSKAPRLIGLLQKGIHILGLNHSISETQEVEYDKLSVLPGTEDIAPYLRDLSIYDNTKSRKILDQLSAPEFISAYDVLDTLLYYAKNDPVAIVGCGNFFPRSSDQEITLDPERFRIPPRTEKTMDRFQKMVLLAAEESIQNVKFNSKTNDRVGFVLGFDGAHLLNNYRSCSRVAWAIFKEKLISILSPSDLQTVERIMLKDLPTISEDSLPGSLPNVAIGRVMNQYNFRGPSFVVSSESGAISAAIDQAVSILQSGECETVIAGVGSTLPDPGTLECYLAECDNEKDRLELNEGVQLFVLKKKSQAMRDGNLIHALIPEALLNKRQQKTQAPIAIVGIGSLLPGAANTSDFQKNIVEGNKDFICELPDEAWRAHKNAFYHSDPETSDKSYGTKAALIKRSLKTTYERIDRSYIFFFHALEEALQGLSLEKKRISLIAGESKSGSSNAWELALATNLKTLASILQKICPAQGKELVCSIEQSLFQKPLAITADTRTGFTFSLALGILRKTLKFEKTMAIDAACASSLAAIASSVRELRLGKIDVAISGGVGPSISPVHNIMFSRCRALSATGSRPFDRTADGIILGEGAGVVVLKRLEDAERDGDIVYGIIRGVGGSSDGNGSSMIAPSSVGQELAIKRALEQFNDDPTTIQFVECHATGTPIGDETELVALQKVYCEKQRATPLLIGSVKSQIGHTIGAAGAAGLIKATLGLHNQKIPPTLIRNELHPKLCAAENEIQVVTNATEWPTNKNGLPRRAAVSAFGFGGTNWHLILEEAPGTNKTAFLFPGHGSLYENVGRELYNKFPVFRRTIQEASDIMAPFLGRAIEDLLFDRESILKTDIVQPCVTALNIAFYRLLRESGLKPNFVLGHSLGEFSAAVAAGVLDFHEALVATYQRGKVFRDFQESGVDTGQMAAIFASERTVTQTLIKNHVSVEIANINSLLQTVISGTKNQIQNAIDIFESLNIGTYLLPISVGWHSKLCSDLGNKKIRDYFAILAINQPKIALLSSIDGKTYKDKIDAEKFRENLITQLGLKMDFVSHIQRLYSMGTRTFVEVGAKKTLSKFVSNILDWRHHQVFFTSSPKVDEIQQFKTVVTSLTIKSDSFKAQKVSNPQSSNTSAYNERTVASPQLSSNCQILFSNTQEIIDFVLKIVQEKTGYTRELLSLDANLESDLGIDSIKQLQILAAIRKQLGISISQGVRVRDFSTLKHWVDFIEGVNKAETSKVREDLWITQRYEFETCPVSSVSQSSNIKSGLIVVAIDDEIKAKLLSAKLTEHDLRNCTAKDIYELLSIAKTLDKNLDYFFLITDKLAGAGSGFMKTFSLENPTIHTRVISFPPQDISEINQEQVFEKIFDELKITESPIEIHYEYFTRTHRHLISKPLDLSRSRILELSKDSVIVCSGGSTGISFEILKCLSQRYQPTLVILGRRSLSGVETAIQELKNLGSEVFYFQIDVSDEKQIQTWITEVESKFNRIDGIIHGAGIVDDCRIENKSKESFYRVYQVKVNGIRNLSKLAKKFRPKFISAFSSIAAVFGNEGQCDYAAANSEMTKILTELHMNLPNTKCISIAWDAWNDIGMAARFGFSNGIAVDEGVRIFHDEILYGPSINEVVIRSEKRNPASSLGSYFIISKELSIEKFPWLSDHTFLDQPVLPATVGIEFMIETALPLFPGFHFKAITNFQVHAPITFSKTDTCLLHIQARGLSTEKESTREVKLQLGQDPISPNFTSTILLARTESSITKKEIQRDHISREAVGLISSKEIYEKIELGPSFHVLDTYWKAGNTGIGKMTRAKHFWKFDELSCIEAAFHIASLIKLETGARAIPKSFSTLEKFKDFNEENTYYAAVTERSPDHFDVMILDKNHNICIVVSDYQVSKIGANV